MTPRRRHHGGSSSQHDTPDPSTRRPAGGTGGDGVTVDTDGIDTMAGRLDDTAGRVDDIGGRVERVDVGPQSMGMLGSGFTGAARTHLGKARALLARVKERIGHAREGTKATAQTYRDTDRTNAENLARPDAETDVTPARGNDTTTPSGTTDPPGGTTTRPPATNDQTPPPGRTDQPANQPATQPPDSGGSGNEPPGHRQDPPASDDGGDNPLPRRPKNPREPHPELTPEEKAALNQRLTQLEKENPEKFAELAKDPDHNNKVTKGSRDEARIAMDLHERGQGPFAGDYRRPDGPGQGDFIGGNGRPQDMKGAHSDWPPEVPEHVRQRPFPNAYNEADFRETVEGQFDRGRDVVVDTRNANQHDIDEMRRIVEEEGWGDRITWYP
ncbi:hypothetical protein [Actinophytocola sp.]|uniref:WXG100 family type VII secretion target n=1 Tax=Actinophytocola sp. TaxID=1872138 RepID=UPI002ED8AB77